MKWSTFSLILLSVFFASVILLMPASFEIKKALPNIIFLVVIYFILRYPQFFGLGAVFTVSLLWDGVSSGYFGISALSWLLVSSLVIKNYQRLQMFTVIQQGAVIFLLLLLEQALNNWFYLLLYGVNGFELSFLRAFLGASLWVPLSLFLAKADSRMSQVFY